MTENKNNSSIQSNQECGSAPEYIIINNNYGFTSRWPLLRGCINISSRGLCACRNFAADYFCSDYETARTLSYNCQKWNDLNKRVDFVLNSNKNPFKKLIANIGYNMLRFQKAAELATDMSWSRYERLFRFFEDSSVVGNDGALSALISKELNIYNAETDVHSSYTKPQGDNDIKNVCSYAVLMKWIEQQRQLMQGDDMAINKTPVLLDLTYCDKTAKDDKPIVLLDNSISVNKDGVFLNEQNDEARTACASVLLTAIRTAAALKLPINMTAVMPLTIPSSPTKTVNNIKELTNDDTATSSALTKHNNTLPGFDITKNKTLVISIKYRPQCLCDIEAFGVEPSITLIFNKQYPIWRHFHISRAELTGLLEPLWKLVSENDEIDWYCKDWLQKQQAVTVAHSNCSSENMQELLTLAADNIVPHMVWYNRDNEVLRTVIRFFRDVASDNDDEFAENVVRVYDNLNSDIAAITEF